MLHLFNHISAFVFDVDGVLTDGSLFLFPGGEMVRRMNIKDGYALQLAVKRGYKVVIISGGFSELVKERLAKLGITDVFMAVHDKKQVLLIICTCIIYRQSKCFLWGMIFLTWK